MYCFWFACSVLCKLTFLRRLGRVLHVCAVCLSSVRRSVSTERSPAVRSYVCVLTWCFVLLLTGLLTCVCSMCLANRGSLYPYSFSCVRVHIMFVFLALFFVQASAPYFSCVCALVHFLYMSRDRGCVTACSPQPRPPVIHGRSSLSCDTARSVFAVCLTPGSHYGLESYLPLHAATRSTSETQRGARQYASRGCHTSALANIARFSVGERVSLASCERH